MCDALLTFCRETASEVDVDIHTGPIVIVMYPLRAGHIIFGPPKMGGVQIRWVAWKSHSKLRVMLTCRVVAEARLGYTLGYMSLSGGMTMITAVNRL